jgi:antitoxin component YwqK of YwqJK toxin-antitoxin module
MKALLSLVFLLLCLQISSAQTEYVSQVNDSIRMEYKLSNASEQDTVYERKMYKNDTLVEHLYLKNNLMIGRYYSYYDNGERLMEGFYDQNGKASGKWRRYYKGGNKASELTYDDGALNGKAIFYYPSGKLREFGHFKAESYNFMISGMNVPHLVESRVGVWEYYHESGGLKAKGEFWFDEIPMRSPQEMMDAMESMETGEFVKPWKVDLKHGKWQYWNTDGKLIKEEIYEKGELVEMIKIKN